jgi:hypothetical protein
LNTDNAELKRILNSATNYNNMQTVNSTNIVKSYGNSTNEKLLAGEVFSGTPIHVSDFIQTIIYCISDAPTASFNVLFSTSGEDGTWNISHQLEMCPENGILTVNQSVSVFGHYMKIEYVNGEEDQNIFVLSTFLNRFRNPELMGTVSGRIDRNQYTSISRLGSDYKRDVAMGKISGNSNFIVNGTREIGVESQWTTLSSIDDVKYTFPTVARRLYVVSTSADDDYGTGSGAWIVYIDGLDANFNTITETLQLSGLSESASTAQSFIRVNKFVCVVTGTYEKSNVGKIKLYSETDGVELSCICPGYGRSINAVYTVPKGSACVIPRVALFCDNGHTVSFDGYFRKNNIPIGPPYIPPMIINNISGFSGITEIKPEEYVKFDEGTDFWVEVKKDSGIGSASVSVVYDVDLLEY